MNTPPKFSALEVSVNRVGGLELRAETTGRARMLVMVRDANGGEPRYPNDLTRMIFDGCQFDFAGVLRLGIPCRIQLRTGSEYAQTESKPLRTAHVRSWCKGRFGGTHDGIGDVRTSSAFPLLSEFRGSFQSSGRKVQFIAHRDEIGTMLAELGWQPLYPIPQVCG